MKRRMTYAARIFKEDGVYYAEFPQLGLITQGKDMEDIICMAADALETHFLDYVNDEVSPPASNLNIEVREGDTYVIVSVYVDPLADYELTTQEVMDLLDVNKQRVAQLRNSGRLSARKEGRDYFHSRTGTEALVKKERKAGRPRKIAA